MAGQPARVILTFIAPCYHNIVFIIETAEMAQYLNYILYIAMLYTNINPTKYVIFTV